MLKFKKLRPEAKLPVYASDGAACFDFFALIDLPYPSPSRISTTIEMLSTLVISTGLSVEIPKNNVMLLFSRSGHGFKNNIRLSNCVGVIDSDYRGEIKIKLANDQCENFEITNGDRIAQGMILPVNRQQIIEVSELTETIRGEGGFGSTGTNEVKQTIEQINQKRFAERLDSLSKHE